MTNPYSRALAHENHSFKTACENEDGTEIIIISRKIADEFFEWKECAFVRQESELDSAEPEALCCDGGAPSSLPSSFLNCTEITERPMTPTRQLKAAL
jgi:hypothetical protein